MPKEFDDNVPTIDLSDMEDIREEVQIEAVFGKTFKASILGNSTQEMMLDENKQPVWTVIIQINALLKLEDYNELMKMMNSKKELLLTADPLSEDAEPTDG